MVIQNVISHLLAESNPYQVGEEGRRDLIGYLETKSGYHLAGTVDDKDVYVKTDKSYVSPALALADKHNNGAVAIHRIKDIHSRPQYLVETDIKTEGENQTVLKVLRILCDLNEVENENVRIREGNERAAQAPEHPKYPKQPPLRLPSEIFPASRFEPPGLALYEVRRMLQDTSGIMVVQYPHLGNEGQKLADRTVLCVEKGKLSKNLRALAYFDDTEDAQAQNVWLNLGLIKEIIEEPRSSPIKNTITEHFPLSILYLAQSVYDRRGFGIG